MANPRFDETLISRIGDRLREVRESKNLSQDEAKESTKLDIGRYERGEANLSVTTLAIMCKHYEITLEEFFKGITI